MNKLVLLIVLLAGAFSIAHGQQKVIFSGEVRDDQGAPLEFANVIAIDTVKKNHGGLCCN